MVGKSKAFRVRREDPFDTGNDKRRCGHFRGARLFGSDGGVDDFVGAGVVDAFTRFVFDGVGAGLPRGRKAPRLST